MISITKTEHKRFRGLTVADRIKVWGITDGCLLHLTGSPKIINTLKRNLMKKFKLPNPVTKPRQESLDMWFSINQDEMKSIVAFIEKFNKKRKNKIVFCIS